GAAWLLPRRPGMPMQVMLRWTWIASSPRRRSRGPSRSRGAAAVHLSWGPIALGVGGAATGMAPPWPILLCAVPRRPIIPSPGLPPGLSGNPSGRHRPPSTAASRLSRQRLRRSNPPSWKGPDVPRYAAPILHGAASLLALLSTTPGLGVEQRSGERGSTPAVSGINERMRRLVRDREIARAVALVAAPHRAAHRAAT